MSSRSTRATDAVHEVVVGGELDVQTAGQLRSQLGQAMGSSASVVVVDTSAVTSIDFAGLRELVAGHHKLRAGGRVVRLRSPSAAVVRILQWTGLSEVFGVDEERPAVSRAARGLGIGGARLHLVPTLVPAAPAVSGGLTDALTG